MKISAITASLSRSMTPNVVKNKNKNKNNGEYQSYSYIPIAYKDFDIAFTAKNVDYRKHWTPEEFYDLPSNKNNMPFTMKEYLYADYETRYHQSPIKIMSESFSGIENAKTLEDVKKIFSKEELFQNLTSKPNKIAKIGVLAEHRVFGDMGALFVDGSDDLGMYLLKKIYLEGKQLHEINKDFQKDIADAYKGALSEIKDEDLYAFGIRRPKYSFWNSLTHNREDFPYEYKPKNIVKNSVQEVKSTLKPLVVHKPHKKFNSPQLNSLTDHLLDMWKEVEPKEQNKRLKRLKLGDEGEAFYNRFRCPISTIAADKVGLSAKLSEFMTDGFKPENLSKYVAQLEKEDAVLLDFDNPNNAIKAVMRAFWKQNQALKAEYGSVIKKTIKEFEQAYEKGEDSLEMISLLKKADELKEARAIRYSEYNKLRYEKQKLKALEKVNEQKQLPKTASSDIKQKVKKVLILKDKFKNYFYENSQFIPEKYLNSYFNYVNKHPLITDEVMEDVLSGGSEKADEAFMEVNEQLRNKSADKVHAAHQAMLDYLSTTHLKDSVHSMYELDINKISQLAIAGGLEPNDENKKFINALYDKYSKPFTDKQEVNAVIKKITDLLLEYKISDVHCNETGGLIAVMANNMRENKSYKISVEKLLTKTHFIENYGITSKIVLSKDYTRKEIFAKMENIMVHFIGQNANNNQLNRILVANMETAKNLLQFSHPFSYDLLRNIDGYLKRVL